MLRVCKKNTTYCRKKLTRATLRPKAKKRERIITCVDRRRSVIFLLDKGTSELENQEERRERERGPPARRRACEEAPPKECAFSLPAAATPHIMMPKTS